MTSNILRDKMAQVGARVLVKTLDAIAQGKYTEAYMVNRESKIITPEIRLQTECYV